MSDVFDTTKRSYVMSCIRGRGNRSTELKLAEGFRQRGVVGWRRHVLLKPHIAKETQEQRELHQRISVRPDFIFRPQKVAVFVDGCFWHGCPEHSKKPMTNPEFWANKLTGNMQRDQRATKALQAAGWTVLRAWEHELKHPGTVVEQVVAFLFSDG